MEYLIIVCFFLLCHLAVLVFFISEVSFSQYDGNLTKEMSYSSISQRSFMCGSTTFKFWSIDRLFRLLISPRLYPSHHWLFVQMLPDHVVISLTSSTGGPEQQSPIYMSVTPLPNCRFANDWNFLDAFVRRLHCAPCEHLGPQAIQVVYDRK